MTVRQEGVRPARSGAGHHGAGVTASAAAALLGLGIAALQVADGAERESVSTTVLVACFCYVAAAATGRPWVAWASIPVAAGALTLAQGVDLPGWAGLVAAHVLTAAAAAALVAERRGLVGAQVLAAVGFGGLAVLALALPVRAGATLAGLALAAHAGWDVAHLRRRTVVHPTLAWFCLLLDVPLGLAAVTLAVG